MKSYIYAVFLIIALHSCEDVFEKEPLDRISDAAVWDNPSLVQAYVTDLYARFPFFQFSNFTLVDKATITSNLNNENVITTGGMSHTSEGLGYWNYSLIRDLNFFIERIQDSEISPELKAQLEGEVRTIRAVVYFEKQKRYGGVPLVDVVLDPLLETDVTYLRRSAEESIADFVDSELTIAIGLLGTDISQKGRINRYTAYAYKARANLWTASIAKYSTVQLDGLVGIPANRANEFYEKAANAANAVIQSGRYQLYEQFSDRSENYRHIFIEDGNSEVIFERLYDGVTIGHGFSRDNHPTRFSDGIGSITNPVLEFLLGYENIDGSADQPLLGPDHIYADGIDLFSKKDPRLRATVFLQGESFAGDIISTYDGLDPNPQPDPAGIIAGVGTYHEGTPTVGPDGRYQDSHWVTSTGFLLRKYTSNTTFIPVGQETTSWKAVRLAEMHLTLAEAEFERGNLGPAATALNATRARAGISLVDENSITLDHVRTERKNELAFEGFRWWDLRRWRIARDVLQREDTFTGLRIILHYETGQYYFFPSEAEPFTRVFREEHYYNPITAARMENNSYLVENPGY